MIRLIKWFGATVALLTLIFWQITSPQFLQQTDLPDHQGDPRNGAQVFLAGGCTSCHGENLEGGLEVKSDFGTFVVPNISPDPVTGIGNWSTLDLVNAMMLGTSPDGRHYYPSFPYTSYTRMKVQDIIDLKAHMDTLEPVSHRVKPHDVPFPWSLRRGIGLWKLRYMKQSPVEKFTTANPLVERGQYLVEGAGHCGECHTARGLFGGLNASLWLAGAPNPDGEGRVPNITPHDEGLGSWSESDITYYLEEGFTPDFDTVGGSMVNVQEHLAQLPATDREAIAAYLKAIPARP